MEISGEIKFIRRSCRAQNKTPQHQVIRSSSIISLTFACCCCCCSNCCYLWYVVWKTSVLRTETTPIVSVRLLLPLLLLLLVYKYNIVFSLRMGKTVINTTMFLLCVYCCDSVCFHSKAYNCIWYLNTLELP